MFQDIGSSLASMQAGKFVDSYACFPGHACQQSDAEQAYVQAELKGTETWIALPKEAWPASWFDKKGNPPIRPTSGETQKGSLRSPGRGNLLGAALRESGTINWVRTSGVLAVLLLPQGMESIAFCLRG